jgi:hypothetical protein
VVVVVVVVLSPLVDLSRLILRNLSNSSSSSTHHYSHTHTRPKKAMNENNELGENDDDAVERFFNFNFLLFDCFGFVLNNRIVEIVVDVEITLIPLLLLFASGKLNGPILQWANTKMINSHVI